MSLINTGIPSDEKTANRQGAHQQTNIKFKQSFS